MTNINNRIEQEIYNKAIFFLHKRDYGEYELCLKLKKYFDVDDSIILKQLERLKDLDFLNENRYVESVINNKIDKYSLRYIKMYLKNKNINIESYNEIFDKYEYKELDTMRFLIDKKKQLGYSDKKIIKYLQNKGFLLNKINNLIENLHV